jgi:hypothetical protein
MLPRRPSEELAERRARSKFIAPFSSCPAFPHYLSLGEVAPKWAF